MIHRVDRKVIKDQKLPSKIHKVKVDPSQEKENWQHKSYYHF